ncbi:hypothetical protein GCM10009785_19860 [Brooklawnia cerclae]|uniref:DNA-binding protein n=1 Tax=Brooklawnia cerclae TaxID=349934 RepID=A0ABX0SFW0_9ACTN|nr:helix-turn-helix domain-containing protein [Brooklawnia cerclae]NIH57273.1 hypothetical protein [Brooklawnia cerclae]
MPTAPDLESIGPWYRAAQAAPMVGTSPRDFWKLCATGQIACMPVMCRDGRTVHHYKVSAQAIRAYLAKHTQPVRN